MNRQHRANRFTNGRKKTGGNEKDYMIHMQIIFIHKYSITGVSVPDVSRQPIRTE